MKISTYIMADKSRRSESEKSINFRKLHGRGGNSEELATATSSNSSLGKIIPALSSPQLKFQTRVRSRKSEQDQKIKIKSSKSNCQVSGEQENANNISSSSEAENVSESSSENDDNDQPQMNDSNSSSYSHVTQLLSLGSVNPLFEIADRYEEQEEHDAQVAKEIEIEFVCGDSPSYQGGENSSSVESIQSNPIILSAFPPPRHAVSEIQMRNGFEMRTEQREQQNNKSIGKMFKNVKKQVRSSFSSANFKRLGSMAFNTMSKTALDYYQDPENFAMKPEQRQKKSKHHSRRDHNHHHQNYGEQEQQQDEPTTESEVVPFKWNPNLHTDPEFKAFVVVTKFSKDSNNVVALPDWLSCPLPEEGLEISNQQGTRQDQLQLMEVVQRECKSVQRKQTSLWEKAVHIGEKNAQDFHKIFLFASSKVELSTEIKALAYWKFNTNEDTLAIGSHDGVLKLLEFKDLTNRAHAKISSVKHLSSIITRNESLKAHIETINHLAWIPSSCGKEGKLMSTDVHGVIIGWKIFDTSGLHKVDFVQEEASSNILEFAWSPDGSKVCILFSDEGDDENLLYGMVMGSSDGQRLWSQCLPNPSPPQAITWQDSQSFILLQENAITVHHFNGIKKQSRYFGEDELGDVDMQNESLGQFVSLLVKPSQNIGLVTHVLIWERRILMLKTLEDLQPVNFEPQLTATCADWSSNGAFIAIAGHNWLEEDSKPNSQVNVYNGSGKLLTILKLHQPSISSLSWNSDSTKFAMGSNTLLYVATVSTVHKFASSGTVHAYAFESEKENFVGFWDMKILKIQKVDGKVVDLKNCGERFVLLSMNSEAIYSVSVMSRVGLCIDVLVILTMQPFEAALTDSCVICLSAKSILFWRYNTAIAMSDGHGDFGLKSESRSASHNTRQIHIDDESSLLPTLELDRKKKPDFHKATLDAAVCMDVKFDRLCVARFSGKLQIYCLPQGGLLHCVEVAKFSPFQIMFNPNGHIIALLGMDGSLRYAHVLQDSTIKIDPDDTVTTGVLNMSWSKDMPNFLCVMKRTEMCILHNGHFEKFDEYHSLSGYIADFNNMSITLISLEQILLNPTRPDYSHVVEIPMKILEFTRQSFQSGDETEIASFKENIRMINHPRFWGICGEEELKRRNFEEAEFAFVTSKNYAALQFLKRVCVIPRQLQEAEIYAFLEDYEKASECYIAAKRTDLALEMWEELGDENQKFNILKVYDASGMNDLCFEVAERHFSGGDVGTAYKMFKCLKQYDRAFECLMVMDNSCELKNFVKRIPKDDEVLGKIAEKYAFMGMTKEAVDIYLEAGVPKKALEIALSNLEWSLALEVASEHDIPMVTTSILNLTKQLLSSGDIMQGVQFLKKCGKTFAAGKLLATVTLRTLQTASNANLLNMKKLFVMSATLLQQKTHSSLKSRTRARTKASPFSFEDDIDLKFDKYIQEEFNLKVEELRWMRLTPWRGVLAVHYLMFAQILIYERLFERATIVATHLRTFVDILGEERINCIIALACANGKHLTQCLGALTHLENIDESYAEIAVELLSINKQHRTHEVNSYICCGLKIQEGSPQLCPKCDLKSPVCVISGRVLKPEGTWECNNCGAFASRKKIKRFNNCPVCHCVGILV